MLLAMLFVLLYFGQQQRKALQMKEHPIVIHIPHSSHYIPEFLRKDILLSDEELLLYENVFNILTYPVSDFKNNILAADSRFLQGFQTDLP